MCTCIEVVNLGEKSMRGASGRIIHTISFSFTLCIMYRFVGDARYIWNSEVRCEGTEWFIQDCQLSYHRCSNFKGAGVICEGMI